MIKATIQRATITRTVILRLNTRRNAMGLLIARYLSMLIAVMVKTEAATATPTKASGYQRARTSRIIIVPFKSLVRYAPRTRSRGNETILESLFGQMESGFSVGGKVALNEGKWCSLHLRLGSGEHHTSAMDMLTAHVHTPTQTALVNLLCTSHSDSRPFCWQKALHPGNSRRLYFFLVHWLGHFHGWKQVGHGDGSNDRLLSFSI